MMVRFGGNGGCVEKVGVTAATLVTGTGVLNTVRLAAFGKTLPKTAEMPVPKS